MWAYYAAILGQLKCVRSPGVIGAISAIIIEYIISVYPLLRHHRVGKNIRFTQYFIHEIIFLVDLSCRL